MQTLIETARQLKPGQRIRIAQFDVSVPRVERVFTRTLTDAQIYAYQDKWIMDEEWTPDRKVLYCTIIDKRDFLHLLADIIRQR